MKRISKSFSGVPALASVDFSVQGGEIHALLGANGAGKSTLMKVLSGAYEADDGSIELNGEKLSVGSPADAKAAGIHCVYQEVDTSLVAHMTVAENIYLDRLASSRGGAFVKWSGMFDAAESTMRQLGLDIPARKRAGELSLAEKQLVLIARVLVEEAKVVILDEPTAPLSIEEAERLFVIMNRLKSAGIAVIFISHRLPEVFRMCDRISVMRDGRMIVTEKTDKLAPPDVIRAMLGRSFEEEYPKREAAIGERLLEVKGLAAGRRVRGVNFDVRRGEIVAIVGLVGAGKTELSRLLFGADPADEGRVEMNGKPVDLSSPAAAFRDGIVLVPEERRKEGILVKESVLRNLSLPVLRTISRLGVLSPAVERNYADGLIGRLGIKASSPSQLTGTLSGGNQQKVVIGKWIQTDAELFVLDEPTKGVDVGAKRDIFNIIGDLALQGKGVLYLTCEFAEALGLADRILVMCDGRIAKQFARGEATQEDLLYYASGGQEE